MTRKGRKLWQKTLYREAHELLQKTLIQAINGMIKTQLREKTGLSRPTIDRHLKDFMDQRKVEQWGLLFFWSTNYLIQLERYRLIIDILKKQEQADAVFKIKVAIAQDTLKGEELRKRLDEIYLEELGWRWQVLREQKIRGVAGAEEKEAMVKDAIKRLRQLICRK